jgi:hypothetical protein
LYQLEEEDEAHLLVPSEWRGKVCSGGAIARSVVAVGGFSVVFLEGLPFRGEGERRGSVVGVEEKACRR